MVTSAGDSVFTPATLLFVTLIISECIVESYESEVDAPYVYLTMQKWVQIFRPYGYLAVPEPTQILVKVLNTLVKGSFSEVVEK